MAPKRKWILTVALASIVLASSALMELRRSEGRLFPFYLPWDDSAETAVSLSGSLDKPAGKLGHISAGGDGHLYAGDRRIRLLGVNIVGGAAFPSKEDAEAITARLAKFGVNAVRFHHMDASWESLNIFNKTYGNTRHLSQEALDRLDYFVYQLKKNGIYVDLNLLVSRTFTNADGLPAEVNGVDWKDQQVLGFFVDELTGLEREYARQLLTHLNPYTGLTYAEDPAVAFVEIVNEQGLIQGWLGGVIDRLPTVFKERLAIKWNDYLKLKYGSTQGLLQAWGGEEGGPQVELLGNGLFQAGTEGWSVENHDGAQSSDSIVDGPDGLKALEIKVSQVGSASWYVQFNYPHLRVEEGQNYLLTFYARADQPATVTVSLMQAHEPWDGLSNAVQIALTTDWRKYEVALLASAGEGDARLDITNLGATTATYQFAAFSLKAFRGWGLREGEGLENSSVGIFTLDEFGGGTLAARRDWAEFLWDLEEQYFMGMRRYLKEELGVKSLIIGTIVGCSTPNIMAQLDVVDTHAYWQHPSFPGVDWDPQNWYVVNEPIIDHLDDGTINGLALKRVYGKPMTVTEYNHPAPNMYDAETDVVLSAYAALQDWDGIFLFDYGSQDDWNSMRIRGYFDIDQHPTKMATLIMAYNMFVRGDIAPATMVVATSLDPEGEVDLLSRGKVTSWNLPDGSYLGMDPVTPLVHRTALVAEGGQAPDRGLSPSNFTARGPIYRSDTGELTWNITDRERGVLLINTSRTVVVAGFSGGRAFDFGSAVIEPGDTVLDGWSVVAMSVMEGQSFSDWKGLLLIAAGYTTNTGMKISAYEDGRTITVGSTDTNKIERYNGDITCGPNWGTAPTLVEGVPVTVRLRGSDVIEVWALDNVGKEVKRVTTTVQGNDTVFVIGPEYKTIWYEIINEE
jgi:hypothetical protein